ncbi:MULTISPECIES: magnesium transporter MgtE N-terminal domain-containing protein [Actinomyces]|uniref:CBS domain-containing protein n=1 Tax=Actinomyces oris TaxID=544580 RepID=A0AAW9KHF8_9ACTO|nr:MULTISPECIES: CBS domain-containing protein [Actinomyces]MEA1303806.1 CBS domain-containing protein [Actinomyces oris]OLO55218.1 magnesium transporter [Actinomyces oris]OLO60685.1 magnesium transporter [Actinomyces oris]OLO64815.1 magnesium transporter [Actinomyces oris]OLO67859.1 magnesium transporter [Actinomyces oris]
MENTRTRTTTRVFVARLIGTSVFDPLGDAVGKVHDVVVLLQMRGEPRAVGFVIDVSSRRRVFLPLSRITAIKPGAVITTGLMNIRRFTQRHVETLVVGELLDRVVTMRDGSGTVTVRDVAIERDRGMDWKVTRLFVQRASSGPLGLRRGETFTVRPDEVSGLADSADKQGATALLATLEDLKPADLADVMRDLPQDSQMRVAAELADERLADVLEELGNEDAVALLSRLEAGRAADVLDVMQPDDAADLVADLPQLKATELLGLMEPEEAEDVRRLMAYDDYTAGGLMTTEPIILPPESTVATFLAQSRKAEVPPALAAVGFVCRPPLESPTGKFVGMIHFQRALRERPQRLVGSIVDTDVDSVRPEDSIGTVTRLLATYNLTALPVLDDAGRLLGAVSVDDVLDHLMPDDWRVADEAVTDETIERGANA